MNVETLPTPDGVARRRLLSILSLCKRAGKLLLGSDPVRDGVRAGKVKLVVISSDLSERSRKGVALVCAEGNIEARPVPFTMDELWYEIGKRTGILAVTDPGLARKLNELLDRAAENEEDLHI